MLARELAADSNSCLVVALSRSQQLQFEETALRNLLSSIAESLFPGPPKPVGCFRRRKSMEKRSFENRLLERVLRH